MIDKNSKLYFDKEKYIVKTKNNVNVLIDNEAFVMLKANNTALHVLNLMNGENTVADIINHISEYYKLQKSVTEEFVQDHIENLYQDGFATLKVEKSEEKHDYQKINRIYLEINSREKGELSFAKIKELFEKLEEKGRNSKKVYVYVKGMAPLDHSEIKEIISYLGEKEYTKVWLYIEAKEADDQKIAAFKDNLTALAINVKHIEELTDYKKTQKENMQAFNHTLSLCLEHKIQVYINVLADQDNVEELSDMHQYAYEFELNGFILENLNTRTGIVHKMEFEELYKKEYNKILKNNNFMNSWRNNRIQNDTRNFYLIREEDFCFRNNINVVKRKHCGMEVEEISMDAAGSLYPCHLLHHEVFKYVDLEQYFESYLYSENVVNKKCHDCDVWMLCLGGCRAENYYKNEKIDTPRKNCKEKSEEIEGYLFSV